MKSARAMTLAHELIRFAGFDPLDVPWMVEKFAAAIEARDEEHAATQETQRKTIAGLVAIVEDLQEKLAAVAPGRGEGRICGCCADARTGTEGDCDCETWCPNRFDGRYGRGKHPIAAAPTVAPGVDPVVPLVDDAWSAAREAINKLSDALDIATRAAPPTGEGA